MGIYIAPVQLGSATEAEGLTEGDPILKVSWGDGDVYSIHPTWQCC